MSSHSTDCLRSCVLAGFKMTMETPGRICKCMARKGKLRKEDAHTHAVGPPLGKGVKVSGAAAWPLSMPVFIWFLFLWLNTHQKHLRKVFHRLTCPDHAPSLKEAKAGTQGARCSLIRPRTTRPGMMAPPIVSYALPSIINQESAPTDLHTGQFDGASSSIEVPSSQRTPACVKLTEN